jgi:RNase P subunit RPR2
MSRQKVSRPTCKKCKGTLVPDISFTGDGETRKVVSVGCVNCGERYYKDHPRRSPEGKELNAHRQAGRPGHVIDGRMMH